MSVELQASVQRHWDGKTLKQSTDLLSQQIWCWGQDIQRPEGNWLLETGFDRLAAPANREKCSSVYTRELPHGRRVVLRGFGVFFGDDRLGGIFLKRYEFRPRYTAQSMLECPPWSSEDLPVLKVPNEAQRERSAFLTVELINWIHSYEKDIVERLGVEHRQATLDRWESSKRPIIPAEEMASSWRSLGLAVAENFQALVA